MIDEEIKTYPGIYMMMKTCKLIDFKQEYENLLFDNFSELYQIMKNIGHIPEDIYNRLGFPPDTHYGGKDVPKLDDITQEARYRVKILIACSAV